METLSDLLSKNGSVHFANSIIGNIEMHGLGSMSKLDFETFIFHHLLLNIEKNVSSYELMRVLKITPGKLRSLEMLRSAKYLNLDISNKDNWKLIFNSLEGKKIESEDKENGKIRVYIDDLHVHRLIERFIIEGGSSVDYTLNRNQLVIKYNEFLNLLDKILQVSGSTPLLTAINKDKSALKVKKSFESLGSILSDLKDSFKEKSLEKIAEESIAAIIKIARKQIGV